MSRKRKSRKKSVVPYIIGGSLALAAGLGAGKLLSMKEKTSSKKNINISTRPESPQEEKLIKFLDKSKYEVYDVEPDGNCFFHALSTVLLFKSEGVYTSDELRKSIVDYTLTNNLDDMLFIETFNGGVPVDRNIWKTEMMKYSTYADTRIVLNMINYIKINFGLDLIIFSETNRIFQRRETLNSESLTECDPTKMDLEKILILMHTGNHYMAVVKPIHMLDRGFGRIKKLRKSKKSNKKKSRKFGI